MREVVLTGGPCAGKTTLLGRLEAAHSETHRIFRVPEIPTLIIGSAIPDIRDIYDNDMELYMEVELKMIRFAASVRKHYRQLASSFGTPVTIVYDRGMRDFLAYVPDHEVDNVLNALSGEERRFLDLASYDRVVHLVSAAVGAESFYTRSNNPVRFETLDQAVENDNRAARVWLAHPEFHMVPNTMDFESKMEAAEQLIVTASTDPRQEIERKFRVETPSMASLRDLNATRIVLQQTYIPSVAGVEARVRSWDTGEETFFFFTDKRGDNPSVRQETEIRISREEFNRMSAMTSLTVDKTRYRFVHAGQLFELDHFHRQDLWLLEVELPDKNTPVNLPPQIQALQPVEVTGSTEFSSRHLALQR